jgi:hypothetical protein
MLCDVLSISEAHLLRWLISDRLRQIRLERFGAHGVAELARLIGIGPQEWTEYEEGAMVPAEVVLAFIDITGCCPRWLLMGHGEKYQPRASAAIGSTGGDPEPCEISPTPSRNARLLQLSPRSGLGRGWRNVRSLALPGACAPGY